MPDPRLFPAQLDASQEQTNTLSCSFFQWLASPLPPLFPHPLEDNRKKKQRRNEPIPDSGLFVPIICIWTFFYVLDVLNVGVTSELENLFRF